MASTDANLAEAYLVEAQEQLAKATEVMRTARRHGLRVLRVGRRSYVLGSDFIEYAVASQENVQAGR